MANMKLAYYEIIRHFEKNKKRLVAVADGASCEHWINAEIFAALNTWLCTKNTGEYALNEKNFRDIVIAKEIDGKTKISHAIEVKVFYPHHTVNFDGKKRKSLDQQLRSKRRGESNDTKRVGIVFGIWYAEDNGRGYIPNNKYSTPTEFFKKIREHFDKFKKQYAAQHNFRPSYIVDEMVVKGPAWKTKYSIAAMYFTRR